jgi:hypothetical protein
VDLFPVILRWPRPNHVDEHARKRDNSTNDFSRNNLLGRYPLGEPEPDMSCDPRDKILLPSHCSTAYRSDMCAYLCPCMVRRSWWCSSPEKKKEYRARKKEDPWLVMAFNPP